MKPDANSRLSTIRQGFILIELLVVIDIILILAANSDTFANVYNSITPGTTSLNNPVFNPTP